MDKASNKISTLKCSNNYASEKNGKKKAKILRSDHNTSAVRSQVHEIGHY